jgi:DNA-binding NtrC family response regulator
MSTRMAVQRRTNAGPTILYFGYARELLRAREDAFRAAGFEVHSVCVLEQVLAMIDGSGYDALVIGSRVPEEERNQVAAAFRAKNPRSRIVFLYEGSIHNTEMADALLNGMNAPSDLAFAVAQQVRDNQ